MGILLSKDVERSVKHASIKVAEVCDRLLRYEPIMMAKLMGGGSGGGGDLTQLLSMFTNGTRPTNTTSDSSSE
jgi:hypothetical protein